MILRKAYENLESKIVIPARTQPPHVGHIQMIEAACKSVDKVIIAICSANKLDEKNPYFAAEREMMLDYSLKEKNLTNYTFVHVPDFKTDMEWMNYLNYKSKFTYNTKILSDNNHVLDIYNNAGLKTVTPKEIIKADLYDICATEVRKMIKEDNPEWKKYAATGTLYYHEQFGGKDRLELYKSNLEPIT